MNFDLPPSLYSPSQLEALMSDIETLSNLERRAGVKAAAGEQDSDPKTAELRALVTAQLFGNDPPTKIDTAAWEEFRHRLDELRLHAPVVHITLTSPPTESLKLAIVKWMRQDVSVQLLVEFSFDRSLAGGLILRTPSRIYDLSFHRRIIDRRDRIAALLKDV